MLSFQGRENENSTLAWWVRKVFLALTLLWNLKAKARSLGSLQTSRTRRFCICKDSSKSPVLKQASRLQAPQRLSQGGGASDTDSYSLSTSRGAVPSSKACLPGCRMKLSLRACKAKWHRAVLPSPTQTQIPKEGFDHGGLPQTWTKELSSRRAFGESCPGLCIT